MSVGGAGDATIRMAPASAASVVQPALRDEADALRGLARGLTERRSDFATGAQLEDDLERALTQPDPFACEQKLEAASRRLRADWLRLVAAETSRVLRSPTEVEAHALARRHDAFGYERDFEPEALEARCTEFFPAHEGWASQQVLFSSGQAALASILWTLGESSADKLAIAHQGSYFETRELCARGCAPADLLSATCVVAEPIACDGAFSSSDVAALASQLTRPGQVLVVDETLTAPQSRLPAILEAAPGSLMVVSLVSGLKLMQQGLELANVGIVSGYARDESRAHAFGKDLKRMRTLTGAGLRFVDALALEAPFFLDRGATEAYASRVFAHNGALARRIADNNRLFEPICHPALNDEGVAPYCALRLAQRSDADGLKRLVATLEREAARRQLLFDRGGSFGFRGHRFELIEPETGEAPFLRIAMGYRAGWSCEGVIELIGDVARGVVR